MRKRITKRTVSIVDAMQEAERIAHRKQVRRDYFNEVIRPRAERLMSLYGYEWAKAVTFAKAELNLGL